MKLNAKDTKEWISEFLRDLGVGTVAGTIAISSVYIFWPLLIFGVLMIYLSLDYKRMSVEEFKKLNKEAEKKPSRLPSLIFIIIGAIFLVTWQLIPLIFLIILRVMMYILSKRIL